MLKNPDRKRGEGKYQIEIIKNRFRVNKKPTAFKEDEIRRGPIILGRNFPMKILVIGDRPW